MSIAVRNDRPFSFTIAFLLHAAFFLVGGFVFSKPVEYAVQVGSGGVEVSLTAAPTDPEGSPVDAPVSTKVFEQEATSEETEDVAPSATPNSAYSDSSSTGKDNATFYSSGGAMTDAEPNYLRNPAPAYPWEARQHGWEGVVILKVVVDQSGYPIQIEKEKGSGFGILDESALKAVRKWKFMPAKIGSIPIQSTVRIPVKFELEE